MESIEFENISNYMSYLNANGGRSYQRIRDLKFNGTLIYDFNVKNISKDFRTILLEFIEMLNNPVLNKYPFSRKIQLFNFNDFINCFCCYGYEFGVYFNNNILIKPENNKSFFTFPLFFKEACKRYNIEPYSSMETYEIRDILKKYIDINGRMNPNSRADRNNSEYEETVNTYYTYDYKKYDDYIDVLGRKIDYYNSGEDISKKYMSVDAEYRVFNGWYESSKTKKTYWVSKQFGDGYGYDILDLDEEKEVESLIEVKSSFYNDYFDLTPNEYKTMLETTKHDNSEYLVYKYLYHKQPYIAPKNCYIYKFDKEKQLLVDVHDDNHICEIVETEVYDENGDLRRVFRCSPKELKKERVYTLE